MTDTTDIRIETFPPAPAGPRRDGRNERARRTRAAIVAACRAFMQAGELRPPMQACCRAAGRSIRIGFQSFKTVEGLHLEAADDPPTRDAIVERVLGEGSDALPPELLARVVRALVTGAV